MTYVETAVGMLWISGSLAGTYGMGQAEIARLWSCKVVHQQLIMLQLYNPLYLYTLSPHLGLVLTSILGDQIMFGPHVKYRAVSLKHLSVGTSSKNHKS